MSETTALLTFDYLTEMAYLALTDRKSHRQVTVGATSADRIGDLIIDVARDGSVTGIEFLKPFKDVWRYAPTAAGAMLEHAALQVPVGWFSRYLEIAARAVA